MTGVPLMCIAGLPPASSATRRAGSTVEGWTRSAPRVLQTLLALAVLLWANQACAQSLEVHGFFDVGAMRFSASDSFDAEFGSPVGIVFGGGGGVVLPQKIFIDARASRFKKDGQRVFVTDTGEVFDLGITETVTVTPVEISAGYRFGQSRDTVRPYAGGGISWYRYSQTDQFATPDESVKETFTGFHLLGGAEVRVNTWLGIAGEAAWATVPDALGQEPTSIGTAFDETNLGGVTFRAKVVIGR